IDDTPVGDDGGFLVFRGVERGIAGKSLPLLVIGACRPWSGFADEDRGEDVHQNSRGAFGAGEEQAPVADDVAHFSPAGEGAVDGIGEGELSFDFITGDGADLFSGGAAALGGDVVSFFPYTGGAPEGISGEKAHQVEEMSAKDHHVLAA